MRSLNYAELYLVSGGEDGGDGCGGDCGSAPSDSADGSLSPSDVAATLGGVVGPDGTVSVSITGHSPGVSFADGAVGTIAATALRGVGAEVAVGFATGMGIAVSPVVAVAIPIVAVVVGLGIAYSLARGNRGSFAIQP